MVGGAHIIGEEEVSAFMEHQKFLNRTIQLALDNTRDRQAQPFGSVVVKDGEVIAEGVNQIAACNDPTAHAEIQAIRKACETLGRPELDDCILYASSRPCPLCVEAIGWANLSAVYYAASFDEAGEAGFDPSADWQRPFERVDMKGAQLEPFEQWKKVIL